jgi:hypothetical protein
MNHNSKDRPDTGNENKSAPVSHRKVERPAIERLELPAGALIAFRSSGGLKFRSRQLVIYPDGRLTLSGTDLPKPSAREKLGPDRIAELRKLLADSGFDRIETPARQQPPDSFAYETVAQIDSVAHYVEVFDGSIPEKLRPLIRVLKRLTY